MVALLKLSRHQIFAKKLNCHSHMRHFTVIVHAMCRTCETPMTLMWLTFYRNQERTTKVHVQIVCVMGISIKHDDRLGCFYLSCKQTPFYFCIPPECLNFNFCFRTQWFCTELKCNHKCKS